MNRPPGVRLLLRVLLLVAIARLWLMPLPSSFWVDEMATAFVVHYGAQHPSFAAAPQVPESIYYLLPAAAEKLFGFSEFVLRLPSVPLMALALWAIARLAARLIHPQAGWFAAFACLALHGFNFQAADARPYALGTATAALGLFCLVRWLDTARWIDALAFTALAALLWRVHLLFAPFYLVFAIYFVTRVARGKSPVGWRQATVMAVALGLALTPVALRALDLMRHAGSHVIVAPPTLRDLANALKYGLLLVCGVGAWLVARVMRQRATPTPDGDSILGRFRGWYLKTAGSRGGLWMPLGIDTSEPGPGGTPLPGGMPDATLVLSWWLCQPLGLLVFSWIAGSSVFVSRYYSLALPGAALTATLWASRSLPEVAWKPAAAALGLGALLATGQWTRWWPVHQDSDWRAAAALVRQLESQRDASTIMPVLCPSPFVEARPPFWNPEYGLPGFLYAHLAVYPPGGRILLFPFDDSPQAESYAAQLTSTTLVPSGRFVIYGGAGQAGFWWRWLAQRPELGGWTSHRLGNFGDVTVVFFSKPPE